MVPTVYDDAVPTNDDEFLLEFATIEKPFANWSAHQIDIWQQHFATIEHAYQYKKFEIINPTWARRIKRSKSPYEAKRLAYQKTIDSASWDATRESTMLELLAAKLAQHEDVRLALRQTGARAIVETGNTEDTFWGRGRDGSGQNVLGKIWMYLREELAEADLQ
jgi:N-glycosidase YbiA